ncbi:MAG: hypothetical protein ABI948_06065 [Thermoleophilia bacterium]
MPRLSPLRAGIALAALVGLSTTLRWWAAERIPTPWIAPDELLYGLLGRSLWEHGNLDLLGEPTRFFSLVTPALVGGPLRIGSLETGYDLLKGLQALAMSLAAVPVYLWGRAFLTRFGALAAAALTVAIPGLVYSGLIMTEVAFYPILLLAAWAIARALVRGTVGSQLVALGAVSLATLTRLQAAVLLPVFFTALAVDLLLACDLRRMRRFWPFAAGTALLALIWSLYRLRHGGPFSQVLGGYQAAGETHYSVADALRFVLYHAEYTLVFTGVVPVCAFVLLLVQAVRARPDPELRAYLATTAALTVWLVAEVGIFASRHVGLLAERNLFGLAPLYFLGLMLWIERGLPRPRIPTLAVALGAVVLLLALPVARFVSLPALPDTFTLIPLYRLGVHHPHLNLELVAGAVFLVGVAAFVAVPRQLGVVLPAVLLVVFAAVSVSASRVVAGQAALVQPGTLGSDQRWIDKAATGPVAYVYTGDVYWSSVWETAFWNRRITAVYDLLLAQIPGGLPQPSVGPEEDGRVVTADGKGLRWPYVVASNSITWRGTRLADSSAGLALWRLDPPFRMATWVQNVQYNGVVDEHAKIFAYDCRRGVFRIALRAPGSRSVRLLLNEGAFRRFELGTGETIELTVPASPPPGHRLCSFDLLTSAPVETTRFAFEPAR